MLGCPQTVKQNNRDTRRHGQGVLQCRLQGNPPVDSSDGGSKFPNTALTKHTAQLLMLYHVCDDLSTFCDGCETPLYPREQSRLLSSLYLPHPTQGHVWKPLASGTALPSVESAKQPHIGVGATPSSTTLL